MGKRSRAKTRSAQTTPAGAVGPRQPCPCGSGRRYKACHGDPAGPPGTFVARPFAGLPGEADIVAMREVVPSATAPLRVADPSAHADPPDPADPADPADSSDHADPADQDAREVVLATLLPTAAPALVRPDGTIWLGLQVQHSFGDPSRDLAAVLTRALEAEPGAMVGLTDPPGEGPRLQDLVTSQSLEVTVHEGFGWWIADMEDPSGEVAASLESANAVASPTVRLGGVEAAYWTDVGSKEHLRWVMPHDEEELLTALARVHAAGRDVLVQGSRLVGMFRAHGLLVPVWDLAVGTGAEALEEPAERFAADLAEALAAGTPLTGAERAARSGLANRQLTIR